MKNDLLAFGIDIGGTNTKLGLFSEDGVLLGYQSIPTPFGKADQLVDQISQECQTLLKTHSGLSLGDKRVIGAGVGAPMANYFTGKVEHAPNLGWKNISLQNMIETALKTKASIENDANLAAVGENKWGAGKELNDFVLITLGTGVGSGLILNDKLYRGHGALGGEGGHILIPHDKKRLCTCGGLNHLESFLSAKGIKQTIHELTGEDWTIEKLGQLFRENDLKATTIMNAISDELVSGLVSISVLLGPEAYIIGGGVSKLGETFNHLIEQKLNEKVHFSLKGKTKVLTAKLSAEKGAIYGGAAHIFSEVIWNSP